jgi:hypothetical protein
VSSRRHVLRVLGVLSALALVFAVFAGGASAKMSHKQKVHARHALLRAIKKNPKLIRSKSFIKKASLVDFVLPVTVQLRNSTLAGNPNNATVDLGASLGKREIDLGGTLPAEIKFHDSFDGGALGNVDLDLRQGGGLTTTSIPLLWNTQVSDPTTHWWDSANGPFGGTTAGCGDFLNSGATADTTPPNIPGGAGQSLTITPVAAHGVPVYSPLDTTFSSPIGLVDEYPGVDSIDNLAASKVPGSANNLGGNPSPFPYSAQSVPGGFTQPPSVEDTVLRTGPITLSVATPGTQVNQSTSTDGSGPQGSQNIVIGKSGGQANLFGNIPGKSYGIDVTVSLAGKINSIIRQVDSDFQHLVYTQNWPSAAFQCRQAWTGSVQNYIPDVHLTGNLKIAPAITPSGRLRIAKASLATQVLNGTTQSSHIALAACLMPYSTFAAQKNSSDTTSVKVPSLAAPPASFSPPNGYPIDESTARSAPSANCNATPTQLVQDAGVSPLTTPANPPYSTAADGSQVSVAGDVTVNDVEADVLIGG